MDPIWDGLRLLSSVIVPHCDSPDHHATKVLGQLARDIAETGVEITRLRDGEALVVDGSATLIA